MPCFPARASQTAIVAAFGLLLACAPALAQDDCPDLTSDMRGLTLKYQRIMSDMQGARRALAYLPQDQEAVLRTVGRFAALTSAARAERERILALYRVAVEKECWQFGQASLDQTADSFSRATAGEDETLSGTRRVLSGLATVVK